MHKAPLFFCLLTALLASCSHTQITGGSGSDTELGKTASISGTVQTTQGVAAAGGTVTIRPAHFRADTTGVDTAPPLRITLDAHGRFHVRQLPFGAYSIEVNTPDSLAVRQDVSPDRDEPTIDLGILVVQRRARLSGQVDSGSLQPNQRIYAYIPGTEQVTAVEADGSFAFGSVAPASDARVEFVAFTSDTVVQAAVAIRVSADSVVIPQPVPVSALYIADTLVVRQLLDTNDHEAVAVASVMSVHNSRITALYLDSLQLSVVPPSIGRLDKLAELNLAHNNLTTLPDSLVACSSLSKLWLGYNSFADFPAALWQCTSLRWLEIGHNYIDDSIPATIANLTELDTVYFSYNYIYGISDSIGALKNLTSLNLDYNALGTLPDAITRLGKLRKLMLMQCALSALPDSMQRLSQLVELDVSFNQLTHLPQSLGLIATLSLVDLEFNSLASLPFRGEQIEGFTIFKLRENRLCTLEPAQTEALIVRFPDWPNGQQCKY